MSDEKLKSQDNGKVKKTEKYKKEFDLVNNFEKYQIIKWLGEGATGVVFLIKHKFTEQYFALKIFGYKNNSINEEKVLKEIKKNSSIRLTKSQGYIVDAGTIYGENDCPYYYAIMTYVGGITLKKWKELFKDYKNNKSSFKLSMIEFNVALGFLYQCYLISNDNSFDELTHGDLNENNIIILPGYCIDNMNKNDNIEHYIRLNGSYLYPNDIEIIDYGTSDIDSTTRKYGLYRDTNFIIERVNEIVLSYDFKNMIIKDYNKNNITIETRNAIIGDLFRVITVLHCIEINGTYKFETISEAEKFIMWINKLLFFDLSYKDSIYINSFWNLIYWDLFKMPSKGNFINVDYIAKILRDNINKSFNIEVNDNNFISISL